MNETPLDEFQYVMECMGCKGTWLLTYHEEGHTCCDCRSLDYQMIVRGHRDCLFVWGEKPWEEPCC